MSPPRSSSVKICFLLAKVDLLLFISSNDCCKTRLTVVVMEFEYDEFSSENFELKEKLKLSYLEVDLAQEEYE